jgi:hypothetical protein
MEFLLDGWVREEMVPDAENHQNALRLPGFELP